MDLKHFCFVGWLVCFRRHQEAALWLWEKFFSHSLSGTQQRKSSPDPWMEKLQQVEGKRTQDGLELVGKKGYLGPWGTSGFLSGRSKQTAE